MAITAQGKIYDDTWASNVRIIMLIRRNLGQKTVHFVTNYPDTEKIMVVESSNSIVVHFSKSSLFEYTEEYNHGPLATAEEIDEYGEEFPNDAFTAAELSEMGVYGEVPNVDPTAAELAEMVFPEIPVITAAEAEEMGFPEVMEWPNE